MPNNEQFENPVSETSHILNVEWSKENEVILVEWCDVAQCYKWLNTRSHAKYSRLHAWFTIPAITMSTISGTASFAQESIPEQYQHYAPMVIGSINILIGILTTIQQYLKISELNEAHRVSSISWGKYARNIRIELSKRPEERTSANIFIKHCRDEFDRLMETSPDIKNNVIKEFSKKFSGKEGTDKRIRFEQLRKPDICDTIISANETRHKWYLELEKSVSEQNSNLQTLLTNVSKEKDAFIKQQSDKLLQVEIELSAKAEIEQNRLKQSIEKHKLSNQLLDSTTVVKNQYQQIIQQYIDSFIDLCSRPPSNEEIFENFENEIPIDIIQEFIYNVNNDDNSDNDIDIIDNSDNV
jgi:hypothetical protein